MTRIGPALSYYGAKWRAAPRYPPPRYERIVEPFAGGAGYSLLYHTRDVVLVEKFDRVAAIWRYIIDTDPARIRALPDLEIGQHTDDLDVSDVEKDLIGFWVNKGVAHPCRKFSGFAVQVITGGESGFVWSGRVRERLAMVSHHIKHWTIICGDYRAAPDTSATWFIDPPYNNRAGRHYPHGADGIDYAELGKWCQSRAGQVIVCENEGADWLPFEPFGEIRSNQANSGRVTSREVVWLKGCVEQLDLEDLQ